MSRTCSVPGCSRSVTARLLCNSHYRTDLEVRRAQRQAWCRAPGCSRTAHAKGECLLHYKRMRMHGQYDLPVRGLGPSNHFPGFTRNLHGGYIRLAKSLPDGTVHRIFEHRAVMEALLGRPLGDDENVHHINGDRTDNRVENLELWCTSQPAGQRVEDKVRWAQEILERYGSLTILTA